DVRDGAADGRECLGRADRDAERAVAAAATTAGRAVVRAPLAPERQARSVRGAGHREHEHDSNDERPEPAGITRTRRRSHRAPPPSTRRAASDGRPRPWLVVAECWG